MATIHIDRLLETCIKSGASDLHIHVGRPPVLLPSVLSRSFRSRGVRTLALSLATRVAFVHLFISSEAMCRCRFG